MALRIVFESGPDQGREFVIVGESEVRIGRGPGYHIVPRDRNWKGGLRVEYAKGVYRLTNEMAHAILRDGTTEFAQNTEEIWYNNATVQPTAETVLRCHHVDDPEGQSEPVVETTSTKEWWDSSKMLQVFVTLICLPTAAVLFLMPTDPGEASPSAGDTRGQFSRTHAGLTSVSITPTAKRQAEALAEQLREARLNEVSRRPQDAIEGYLRIREELQRLDKTPANPLRAEPVVKDLADFVKQRIADLSATHQLARDKK